MFFIHCDRNHVTHRTFYSTPVSINKNLRKQINQIEKFVICYYGFRTKKNKQQMFNHPSKPCGHHRAHIIIITQTHGNHHQPRTARNREIDRAASVQRAHRDSIELCEFAGTHACCFPLCQSRISLSSTYMVSRPSEIM